MIPEWHLFTGNELGVLLGYWLIKKWNEQEAIEKSGKVSFMGYFSLMSIMTRNYITYIIILTLLLFFSLSFVESSSTGECSFF